MKRYFRLIALVLSSVCLISIAGCQSQPDPIPSEEPSSVTADLPESSQEPVSSQVEEPVSSEPSVADSKPQPEASSQPEPSSVPEEPSSTVESSEPELPTIPFEVRWKNETGSYVMQEDGTWRCIDLPAGEGFRATLIQNVEEFNQAGYSFEKFSNSSDTDFKNYLSQCDDSYFEEYAVIEIQIEHSSGSLWDEINSITRSSDQLIINWSWMLDTYPQEEEGVVIVTDDMENAFHLLEVKRSDVEGVTEIIGQRSSQSK